MAEEKARSLYIEDRDTDGDGFPDVWEAEQNGNAFDPNKVAPVTGDAEFIAVNTNLTKTLTKKSQGVVDTLLSAMNNVYGASLMSGIPVSSLKTVNGSVVAPAIVTDGSVAITSLDIDREAGDIVLGVSAEATAGEVSPTVAALYSVASGTFVTVKVYRTETLAAEWTLVATEPVLVTDDGIEVRAKLPEGVDTSSGFFKVEIE